MRSPVLLRAIRDSATPRHVSAKVLQVVDIRRNNGGEIVELAVRDIVHGRTAENQEARPNPDALSDFRDRTELPQ